MWCVWTCVQASAESAACRAYMATMWKSTEARACAGLAGCTRSVDSSLAVSGECAIQYYSVETAQEVPKLIKGPHHAGVFWYSVGSVMSISRNAVRAQRYTRVEFVEFSRLLG